MINYFEKVTTQYHHVAPAIFIGSTSDEEAKRAGISTDEFKEMVLGKMALRVEWWGEYRVLQPYAVSW